MTGWYDRRQRAERLAAALREILREADDVAGIARVIGRVIDECGDDGSAFAAVLKGSARDLRAAVTDLLDELHDDLEPAASGFEADQVVWGRPASLERVVQLLSMHDEQS